MSMLSDQNRIVNAREPFAASTAIDVLCIDSLMFVDIMVY